MSNISHAHRVSWKKYLDIDDHPNAQAFLEEHGDEALFHVLEMIEYTYDQDIDTIDVIYFEEQNIVCSVYREEYIELLNSAMKWYLREENYEICAFIRDLIDKINLDES